MDFFVIHTNEDGEASVERLTEELLVQRLNEEYWGDNKFLPALNRGESLDLLEKSGFVIIRGVQVIPTPKSIVKEWGV